MKIRNSFVSNSSSTSFCILGIRLTDEQKELVKWCEEDEMYTVDLGGLNCEAGLEDYDDSAFIGVNPDRIKDDETIGEIKDRIIENLKKVDINIERKNIGWHEQGAYCG